MDFDVVVVGAGPAGATAAKYLAEKEVKVLLLDKSTFPRDKPCGGVISVRTLKRFPYISADLIASYSYGGCIYSSSLRHHIQVHKDEPIAAFVVRNHFDHGLVKRAVESGATLMDGVSATDLDIRKDKATIRFSNGASVESELVIGADGVWSMVAKKSGLGQHYPHIGRCLFQEIPVAGDVLDEYFTEKRNFQIYVKFMGVDGFGWVAPKKDCLNIGIGEIQPSVSQQRKKPHLKEVYQQFIFLLKERKSIPPTITPGSIQGVLSLYDRWIKPLLIASCFVVMPLGR